MRKVKLLWFMVLAIALASCQTEEEEVVNRTSAAISDSRFTAQALLQTKSDGRFTPLWQPGEKVGLFVKYGDQLEGPLPYTIASVAGVVEFIEPLPIRDLTLDHTFYAYHPLEANESTDPERVEVLSVGEMQTQMGASSAHIDGLEYNIAIPTTIVPDEKLLLYFTSVYSFLEFQINTNVDGLIIDNIELKAPDGKLINFTEAYVDLTKPQTDPEFAKLYEVEGGTSTINLAIEGGGLEVPNSYVATSSAYMTINPFDGTGEMLTITVNTNKGEFTFERAGDLYTFGSRNIIPIHIALEEPPVPTVKDIKVLSLCEVGLLGLYDNTKQWNLFYGATDFFLHTKAIRRVLYEHFGPGKTVETGKISFEKTDIKHALNKMTDAQLDKYNIIFLNNNARPNAAMAQKIMNWLDRSEDRVLMLAYDWKEHCVTPNMSADKVILKTATNYLIFRDHITGVTPHWYNGKTNYSNGDYGSLRQDMLVPFELNERTSYFWKDGPFKTDLHEGSDQRYWIEDIWWGVAEVTDPNVIPLITYRDARKDLKPSQTHSKGAGDGGMILGVDPVRRIVYIGDSEIFSIAGVCKGAKQDARMTFDHKKATEMNNYSKIMANLWAWMIDEVIQKN